MIELSKLESLTFDLDKTDAFEECYVKMLAEAWVAGDKDRIRALREILHRQVAFVALEAVKARKEEDETNEIMQ
jgi:hypothetical protein